MKTSVRFICEMCGTEFGDRHDCLMHEYVCGNYPKPGLYAYRHNGHRVYARVPGDSDTVRVVDPTDHAYETMTMSEWARERVLEPITDAQAAIEVHRFYSDRETATLRALEVPPFTREARG